MLLHPWSSGLLHYTSRFGKERRDYCLLMNFEMRSFCGEADVLLTVPKKPFEIKGPILISLAPLRVAAK